MKQKQEAKKILLINPPFIKGRPPNFFPLGLGYIAKSLLNNNYKVEVLDVHALDLSDSQVIKELENREYDIVGISAMITQLSFINKISKIIKKIKPHVKIVVGGWVNCRYDLLFKYGDIDFSVIGDGEITIIELLKAIENNLDLEQVKGIVFKENNRLIKTEPRELQNLDGISPPAWELFEMETYVRCITTRLGKIRSKLFTRGMEMVMSRGCPFKCSYCFKPYGQIYRLRNPQNVIDEIKVLKKKYKVNFMNFKDQLFVFNRDWVMEFCNKLIGQRLKIRWGCCGRMGCVDEEMLNLMKKAGCICIEYGLESASQKILKEMNKNFTIEKAKETIRLTKKARIIPMVNIMFGMPSDNEDTLQKTIDFIDETGVYFSYIAILSPLPDTPIWEYAVKNNYIEDEEKYLLRVGKDYNTINTRQRLSINLTNLSDEEFVDLRTKAINKLKKIHKKKHPIKSNVLYKGIKILLTSRLKDVKYVLSNRKGVK